MKTSDQFITPKEVAAYINTPGAQYELIDVRTPAEFQQVHIAESIKFPLESLKPTTLKEKFPLDHTIILICKTSNRAKTALKKFEEVGFSNTKVMDGGIDGWLAENRAVERGASNIISLERQVRIAAGLLVLIGSLLAYFVNPLWLILSGFVGAGLAFAGITDTCGMALFLAKMPWNQRA